MQNQLLDITILGCLTLLFASTYRKRPSPLVRSWTLGWLLVLVHFLALLVHPDTDLLARTLSIVSVAALIACGVVFLLSARERDRHRGFPILRILAGSVSVLYAVLFTLGVTATASYALLAGVAFAAWTAYAVQLAANRTLRFSLVLATTANTGWLVWAIAHGRFDIGLSAVLCQIYTAVGLVTISILHRLSAGVVTTTFGLIAWAAVFPASELCGHLGILATVSPEFWNVPKYFVAFGMLLVLLEEEIVAANEAGRRLFHQANHDLLTGLPNRAHFEQSLNECLARCQAANTRAALLCLDLDRFKQINDTYGHTVGDLCLQAVAQRLATAVEGFGLAARAGGEEFSLLLYHVDGSRRAESFAASVLRDLRVPILADGYTLELSASIGIAVFPGDGPAAAALWRNADCAMYRAKKAGGDRFLSMSPELGQLSDDANEMEMSLRHALRESGLQLRYQPIFRTSGELHSLEALVYLQHPAHGLVPPARFITVAEERGLITAVGDWVLRELCAQLHFWDSNNLPAPRVHVNISPLQLAQTDFATRVQSILVDCELDPRMLSMEITETAMMRNLAEASRQMNALAALGIVFSVDDFGTGYSSLGQLDKLPVQVLKIDRTFVERIAQSDGTRPIVDAIISMAHSLRLEVIAEGVETVAQAECLRQLSCDCVQGFLYSQPLLPVEVEPLLAAARRPHAGDALLPSTPAAGAPAGLSH